MLKKMFDPPTFLKALNLAINSINARYEVLNFSKDKTINPKELPLMKMKDVFVAVFVVFKILYDGQEAEILEKEKLEVSAEALARSMEEIFGSESLVSQHANDLKKSAMEIVPENYAAELYIMSQLHKKMITTRKLYVDLTAENLKETLGQLVTIIKELPELYEDNNLFIKEMISENIKKITS